MGSLKQQIRKPREIIKLVPGAKFVNVLWSDGYLQCFDISMNTLVWTHPPLGEFPDIRVDAFDAMFDKEMGSIIYILAGVFLVDVPSFRSV